MFVTFALDALNDLQKFLDVNNKSSTYRCKQYQYYSLCKIANVILWKCAVEELKPIGNLQYLHGIPHFGE